MSSSCRMPSFLFVLLTGLLVGPLSAKTWTVKKGETCYRIAKANGLTPKALMAANGIKDPTQLRIGQRLKIPTKTHSKPEKTLTVKTTPATRSIKEASAKPAKKVTPVASRSSISKPSKRSSSSWTSKSVRRTRIVIDPGHGGRDKGAYWYGVSEAALNLKVARRVAAGLKDRGYSVTMTRRSDRYLSLSQRSAVANVMRNAVFISIHFNACTNTRVHGVETFYAGKKGRFLAQCIQTRMVRAVKARNRGVRIGRYAVLMKTKCPAALVECGFISNTRERNRCNSVWYQKAVSQAIVDGIMRYDRVY